MAYMKNSVLTYDSIVSDGYSHQDYSSRDYTKIHSYVETCTDDLFEWYRMNDNDKMERVSYELYGTTDYWDILIMINDLNPLYGLPYAYDIQDTAADETVAKYIAAHPESNIPDVHAEYMHAAYEAYYIHENELGRVIRIVKPSKLQEFLRKGREMGCFA